MAKAEIRAVRLDRGRICIFPVMSDMGDMDPQYIYRAARGVYWDLKEKYFYFAASGKTPAEQQLERILSAAKEELGLELFLSERTSWQNIDRI